MVVYLPVNDDDVVAADDLFKLILMLLAATEIVASTRSLSEVIELVTVACAVVPLAPVSYTHLTLPTTPYV